MATTLKLGNSNWATKESSLLAYNDENDNFKPLPFTTTRASASSRINKLGLIENVTNNIATIDYQGNVNGALLTQPQSTNLITYPVSFGNSYWTKSGASIEGDASTAGSELVTNGDFATDSDWSKGSTWTISGGTANATGNSTNQDLTQSILTVGVHYLISIDIVSSTLSAQAFRVYAGGVFTDFVLTGAAQTITTQLTATSGVLDLRVTSTNSSGTIEIDNVSVKEVQGFTSPSADYTDSAYKLVEDTSTGSHFVTNATTTVLNATNYTETIFVKAGEITKFGMREAFSDAWITVNLSDGSIIDSNNLVSSKITTLINGWYRISITFLTASTSAAIKAYTLDASYTTGTPNTYNYLGDGTSGVYIYGAQVEQLSYPTSLIYNGVEGSTVTRVKDQVTGAGSATVFEDRNASGVLYAEISALGNVGGVRAISLNDGSTDNRISIRYNSTSNQIQYQYNLSSVVQANITYNVADVTASHKIAIRWAVNDFSLYIDGVERGTDVSGNIMPSGTLTSLDINGSSIYDFMYAKTKQVQVLSYQSDAEMITLTTI